MESQKETKPMAMLRIFWIGFTLMLVSLPTVTEGLRELCWTRSQKKFKNDMVSKVSCHEPKATLIPLAVPSGFYWVYPNVVKTNHCNGSMCHTLNKKCVSLQSNNKTIRVQAFKKSNPMEGYQCITLTYEEHVKCGCRCDKDQEDCGMMEEFNPNMCRCECKQSSRQQCRELMKMKNSKKMWDEKSCTCPCNNSDQECGSGAMWVPQMCKCVRMMDMGGEVVGDSTNEI